MSGSDGLSGSPRRSTEMASYLETLSPEDRIQIARIHALLRVGLKSEAACELEEVELPDGRPEKQLLRARVLHASGQFLVAVKAYDNLLRSFRNALPSGFERILYRDVGQYSRHTVGRGTHLRLAWR